MNAGGFSCNRVSDDLAMTGSPAQMANLYIKCSGGASANNCYIYVLYDSILAIDANGAISLIK